jgi:hypothetical protein
MELRIAEWPKRTADVLVDGQKVGEQAIEARGEPKFYDVEYDGFSSCRFPWEN